MSSIMMLVLFAVLQAMVVVGQLAFTTPATSHPCQSKAFSITWRAGSAPYRVGAIPAGADGTAAQPFHLIAASASGTSLSWSVNLAAGTSMALFIMDSTGKTATSGAFTVLASTDAACNPPPTPVVTTQAEPPATNSPTASVPTGPATSTNTSVEQPQITTSVTTSSGGLSDSMMGSPVIATEVSNSSEPPASSADAVLDGPDVTETTSSNTSQSHQTNKTGIIAGVIVGLAGLVIVLILLLLCIKQKRRRDRIRRHYRPRNVLAAEMSEHYHDRSPPIPTSGRRKNAPQSSGPIMGPPFELTPVTPPYSAPLSSSGSTPSLSRPSSFSGATSMTGFSELTPQQAGFVRGLFDHGVAPSVVAGVIQSLLEGGAIPAYDNSRVIVPQEKGRPVVDHTISELYRPLSEADQYGTAPPDYFTSLQEQLQ